LFDAKWVEIKPVLRDCFAQSKNNSAFLDQFEGRTLERILRNYFLPGGIFGMAALHLPFPAMISLLVRSVWLKPSNV
jgi:hypothetical protein